jgi:tetratricopeptide (TPR) repeat protein
MKLTQYISVPIAIFSSIIISEISIASTDLISVDRSAAQKINLYITQNNTESEKYSVSGFKKHTSGDRQGALADYNQAIVIDPKNAIAYNNRGHVKNNYLKDINGAIVDFRQAVKLYRKQANDESGLKLALSNLKIVGATENEESNSTNTTASNSQNNAEARKYYESGSSKIKLGDIQGALADFNQAIAPTLSLASTNNISTARSTNQTSHHNATLIADNVLVSDDLGASFRARMEAKGYEFVETGVVDLRGLETEQGKTETAKAFVFEQGYEYIFSSANGGSDTHTIAIIRKRNGERLNTNVPGLKILNKKDGYRAGQVNYGCNKLGLDRNTFICTAEIALGQSETVYIILQGEKPGKVKWMLLRK